VVKERKTILVSGLDQVIGSKLIGFELLSPEDSVCESKRGEVRLDFSNGKEVLIYADYVDDIMVEGD
jgi:hypothetical protein